MNLIEAIKNIFTNNEFMTDFNGMNIDYTSNEEGNTGLFLTNDKKEKEDAIGNQYRKAFFTIYRNVYSMTDVERLQNSSFILELQSFLEGFKERVEFEYKIGKTTIKQAEIRKISCSNGMAFQYLGGNPSNGVQYMLQMEVDYIVYD